MENIVIFNLFVNVLMIQCRTNQNSIYQNDCLCIPNHDDTIFNQRFICICSKGFIGNHCETNENKLILSFDKDISLSQSILIHFIEIIMDDKPGRATTFKTIPLRQDSIIIYWSQPFHLTFIELLNKIYYLVDIQNIYNRSTIINKTIDSFDRCQNIKVKYSMKVFFNGIFFVVLNIIIYHVKYIHHN